MDEKQADHLGGAWAEQIRDAWPWQDVTASQEAFMDARLTMRLALADFLPDDVSSTVTVRRDGYPLVHAIVGDAVFTATCSFEVIEGQARAIPWASLRRVSLSSEPGVIAVKSKYWQGYGTLWRASSWRFELPDGPLELISERHEGGGAPEEELFARELAARVGWDIPPERRLATVAAA